MAKDKVSKENYVRSVNIRDGRIEYTIFRDGVTDFADYNETLYQLLIQERFRPFRSRGRLKFNVCVKGVDHTFGFADLAMACYLGKVKSETFLEDMQKYYDEKGQNNYDVDHGDNNIHNYTSLNLSQMDSSLNKVKGTIVAKFKPPYYMNTAFCGGEYRVQIITTLDQSYIPKMAAAALDELRKYGITGMGVPRTIQTEMLFVCKDAEDYVACLKHFAEQSYEWCNPGQTPKMYSREHKDLTYWAANTMKSMQMQRELAMKDRAEFQMWPVGNTLTIAAPEDGAKQP